VTVGELKDRRARKKAQTRELIRSVAQRMFDEHGFDGVTIADIAREADVAVQTVFNHFAIKEELFFAGRTRWVDGPADAVLSRDPSLSPLTALREHLVEAVAARVGSHRSAERRRYLATLEASDSLRAYERELVHQAETKLRAALLDTWSADEATAPPDPESAALLVAAVWMATSRSLIVGHRPSLHRGADPEQTAADAMATADRVLGEMERGAFTVHAGADRPRVANADTGWPQDVRRAG
jgi:AcrR family transcriptional regulator